MTGVFVTGATGTVGAGVVSELLARGERVVAAVRSVEAADRLPAGVEAREFDFDTPASAIRRAMTGVDRLFLVRPPQVADVQRYLFPVIDAARDLGVRQVVFLSLQGVQANRRTPHHAVEARLKATGAPYTMLRPNFFMQNLSATYAAEIRERGEIRVPAGRSRTAFIDARDIGRVAATVFTEPGHERRAYTLSGEESLGYRDVARTMTDVLGREITYTRPTEREYLALLEADGRPADYIAVQKMIYRVVRLNVSALPNRSIRRLTGRPATSFREFIRDHRAAWGHG
ncbi:SDR family oxidoreductase [Tessaracoccus sp. MC1627]|uniref:SDR family oxidoreductase n=1 Tax=Tessaracoccus sp. MC1627 TaxID=2760312 RepID=UPI001601F5B7|nr:SDR family oxidoreductase [Tessaracoccus sp. MC1627]